MGQALHDSNHASGTDPCRSALSSLRVLRQYFSDHVLSSPPSYYKYVESDLPDVWLSATRIWEIKCADLSLSPHHKAALGLVHPSKGIALRFPRFVRERVGADEKLVPDGITDAEQVFDMYQAQAVQGGGGGNAGGKKGGR